MRFRSLKSNTEFKGAATFMVRLCFHEKGGNTSLQVVPERFVSHHELINGR